MNAKQKDEPNTVIKNTGHLCSVYCPACGKVTDKISFNLIRDAGKVKVTCPACCGVTVLEYDGKSVSLWHHSEELDKLMRKK